VSTYIYSGNDDDDDDDDFDDEFVWRYNRRGETLFPLLVAEVAKRCVSSVGSLVVKS
jgi:hypothetical protein